MVYVYLHRLLMSTQLIRCWVSSATSHTQHNSNDGLAHGRFLSIININDVLTSCLLIIALSNSFGQGSCTQEDFIPDGPLHVIMEQLCQRSDPGDMIQPNRFVNGAHIQLPGQVLRTLLRFFPDGANCNDMSMCYVMVFGLLPVAYNSPAECI